MEEGITCSWTMAAWQCLRRQPASRVARERLILCVYWALVYTGPGNCMEASHTFVGYLLYSICFNKLYKNQFVLSVP